VLLGGFPAARGRLCQLLARPNSCCVTVWKENGGQNVLEEVDGAARVGDAPRAVIPCPAGPGWGRGVRGRVARWAASPHCDSTKRLRSPG